MLFYRNLIWLSLLLSVQFCSIRAMEEEKEIKTPAQKVKHKKGAYTYSEGAPSTSRQHLHSSEVPLHKSDSSDTDLDDESTIEFLAKQRSEKTFPKHKKSTKESSPLPSYIVAPKRIFSKPLLIKIIESAPEAAQGMVGMLTLETKRKSGGVKAIFYGVPGTSKSTLAVALAQFADRDYRLISAPLLATTYMNSGATNLATIIDPIVKEDPSIVIIVDEIDRLHVVENAQDGPEMALSSLIDRYNEEYPNVAIIGTTNHIDDLSGPFLKRFVEGLIEVPLPNYDVRLQVIKDCCDELLKDNCVGDILTNLTFMQKLAAKTNGFSIRDIEKLFNKAKTLTGIPLAKLMLADMKSKLSKEEAESFVPKSKSLWVRIFGERPQEAPRDQDGRLNITQAQIDAAYTVISKMIERAPSFSSKVASFAWESTKIGTGFLATRAFDMGTQMVASEIVQRRAENRAEERRVKAEDKAAEELRKQQEAEEAAKNNGWWAKTKNFGASTWYIVKWPVSVGAGVAIAKVTKYVCEAYKPEIQKAAKTTGTFIMNGVSKIVLKQ